MMAFVVGLCFSFIAEVSLNNYAEILIAEDSMHGRTLSGQLGSFSLVT